MFCFGIVSITQELEPFYVTILPPPMAVLHCATHNEQKPAYKDGGYTDSLTLALPLNTNVLLVRQCTWGNTSRFISSYEVPRTFSLFLMIFFFYTGNRFSRGGEICSGGIVTRHQDRLSSSPALEQHRCEKCSSSIARLS